LFIALSYHLQQESDWVLTLFVAEYLVFLSG